MTTRKPVRNSRSIPESDSGDNLHQQSLMWFSAWRFALALCCGIVLFALPAWAEDAKTTTPTEETLTTKDGWPIHITYFKSAEGKESPVVILLHQRNGNRLIWREGLAKTLQENGYAVVTVDLRKHGESQLQDGMSTETANIKPIDYKAMFAYDLEAVKEFILQEHIAENLNIRKLAIVAPEMSTPLAIYYTIADWAKKPYNDGPTLATKTPRGQDVRALVMLSPEDTLPNMPTSKALQTIRNPRMNIAVMVGVGSKDTVDNGTAKKMFSILSAPPQNKERMYFEEYNIKLRGTDMLGKNLKVEDHIIAFLGKYLKELDSPWQDRRPRYDRK